MGKKYSQFNTQILFLSLPMCVTYRETDDSEDRFHVISDEEIQRSLTMSAEVEPAAEPEPK